MLSHDPSFSLSGLQYILIGDSFLTEMRYVTTHRKTMYPYKQIPWLQEVMKLLTQL